MPDLEQLRRVTPFMCNIRFRNNLPEVCVVVCVWGALCVCAASGNVCLSADFMQQRHAVSTATVCAPCCETGMSISGVLAAWV